MARKTPEQEAKETAAKIAETKRQAAEQVVDATIGQRVLEIFSARDRISLDELIADFEQDVARERETETPEQNVRLHRAETALNALRSLKAD